MVPPPAPSPDRRALGTRALFAVLLALVAASWLLPYPPHQDFAGHAAMLAIRERLGTSAFLQQYLTTGSTLGPYSIFLWLGHALAGLVGPEGAVRVMGAFANCALPGALVVANRRLFGNDGLSAGFLGLAIALGHLNAQGLISFLMGLGLFVLAFALWIELLTGPHEDPARPRRQAWLAALALLTAFTHGFAFLLLVFCALLTIAAHRWWFGRQRFASALVFLPALLALGAIHLRDRGIYPPVLTEGLLIPRGLVGKIQLPFLTTFFSRLGVDVLVAAILWSLLGAAAIATVRPGAPATDRGATRARRRITLVATAIVLCALALAAPKQVGFFGSLDLRLGCAALLIVILGIAPDEQTPRLRRALRVVPPALAVAMVATLWVAGLLFQGEARPIASLLRRIPAETRLLYLPMNPDSRFWAAAPFWHLEKRVLLERDVIVSNVWLHQGTALRPTPLGLPLLTVTPRATADGEVPWSRYDVTPWDHVLVRNGQMAVPTGTPPALRLVASAGGMHLFRNLNRER